MEQSRPKFRGCSFVSSGRSEVAMNSKAPPRYRSYTSKCDLISYTNNTNSLAERGEAVVSTCTEKTHN